jgi:hypothetical protein
MVLFFYLNAPFVASTADTPSYLTALQQLQTTGNPVNVFRLPTYSLFLLAVYSIAGQGNLIAVSIVQGILFILATLEVYLLLLLMTGRKWLAFGVGVLMGTNVILISYAKPIMTEGLSLWLLTTIMLCTVAFVKTLRPRYFWLSVVGLGFLLFTRPEWILLPCLLFLAVILMTKKKSCTKVIVRRVVSSLAIIYLLVGGYVVANARINHMPSLSVVSNMNLIGKVIQYRMQDETPHNPALSQIYDHYMQLGYTSPYGIMGRAPVLSQNNAQASADWARDILLYHPGEMLFKSVPFFFTSLYHYYPVELIQQNRHGPYDQPLKFLFLLQQCLYSSNILFPFCALVWFALCLYRKTRPLFCVQAMGLLALVVSYAVIITTLGGYYEGDYMRVHIVFDPLIILVVWGSLGLGIYQLRLCIGPLGRKRPGNIRNTPLETVLTLREEP